MWKTLSFEDLQDRVVTTRRCVADNCAAAVAAHDCVAALRAQRPPPHPRRADLAEQVARLADAYQREMEITTWLCAHVERARQQVHEIDALLVDLNPEPQALE